jgi:hypothetical protein
VAGGGESEENAHQRIYDKGGKEGRKEAEKGREMIIISITQMYKFSLE